MGGGNTSITGTLDIASNGYVTSRHGTHVYINPGIHTAVQLQL